MDLQLAHLGSSSSTPSAESFDDHISTVSNLDVDQDIRETTASDMSSDAMDSESVASQASLDEANPRSASPNDTSYDQLVDRIFANHKAGVVDERLVEKFKQVALREQVDSHWTDDRNRNCYHCRDTRTNAYTHGIFAYSNPIESPDTITIDEARAKAEPMSRRIWEDFRKLKIIIERYECVIQKRWAKKSSSKRRQTLQLAWAAISTPPPQPMAEMHRPDVDHLRTRCSKARNLCCEPVDEEKRHLFFWPRLNFEDLTKFEPLLLLLNARGRHSPPAFAFADLEPVHFGLKADRLSHPLFLDMYNMVFTGQEGPEIYGQLVSWEEDPGAYRRLQIGRDTSPGEGLWILEIQERLYKFLVNICKLILHDQRLDDHDRLLAQPVAPEPPLPTANGHGQDIGTSLIITRYESAYHVPAKLDIRRLQNLIESKLAEAEDDLWALREDPSFFAATITEKYQSGPEHIRDTANRCNPLTVEPQAKASFMARVVSMALVANVSAIDHWDIIYDKVSHLADLKERLFDNAKLHPIRPEHDLPPELAMAIYDLLNHLHKLLAGRLKYIAARAQWSPPLRHLYRRRLDFGKNERYNKVALVCSGVQPSPEVSGFLWVLRIMSDPDSCKNFGLHNCIEDLERITRDRAGHKLISKTLAADLSDFTIISECIRQLELFQPWAATFEAGMAESETAHKLDSQYEETMSKQRLCLSWEPSERTCLLGATLVDMPYPVDKSPSKSNIDALREAESLLDTFWDAALLEMKESTKPITERLSKVLLSNKPERTPMWVEPLGGEREITQDDQNGPIIRPFESGPGYAQMESPKVETIEPRVKVKSRGVARWSPTEPEMAKSRHVPQSPIFPIIDMDQRALKVLEMLFYKTSPGSSQGEIPWTDFTYMMHHTGFGVEKLGGSSWQFTPGPTLTARGYTRGIQFHEPHPRAKLAFVVARRYGRRLARAFGWCAEMFRLRTA